MSEEGLHVVFGAGQVGSHLAESLLSSGARVRVAKRSPSGIPTGAEAVLGDATDPAFCRQAVKDADVVYHCMNPEYTTDAWQRILPQYLENLVAAAGGEGSRLVVLENLYMVGSGGGKPIDEDTPFNPQSRKGEIRARMAEKLFDAHARGDVRAVAGRASDFFGPRGDGTHFGERFWDPVFRGKPASFAPNPDTRHTYHFIPDVADGLKELGNGPDEILGRAWMLPCNPAETTRELVSRFEEPLGGTIRIKSPPRFAIKLMGLFVPIVREVEEMLHQWDEPFEVDDTRFREQFGSRPSPPAEAAAATVGWARGRYA